jgi:hypothetical protein
MIPKCDLASLFVISCAPGIRNPIIRCSAGDRNLDNTPTSWSGTSIRPNVSLGLPSELHSISYPSIKAGSLDRRKKGKLEQISTELTQPFALPTFSPYFAIGLFMCCKLVSLIHPFQRKPAYKSRPQTAPGLSPIVAGSFPARNFEELNTNRHNLKQNLSSYSFCSVFDSLLFFNNSAH